MKSEMTFIKTFYFSTPPAFCHSETLFMIHLTPSCNNQVLLYSVCLNVLYYSEIDSEQQHIFSGINQNLALCTWTVFMSVLHHVKCLLTQAEDIWTSWNNRRERERVFGQTAEYQKFSQCNLASAHPIIAFHVQTFDLPPTPPSNYD